MTIRSTRRFRSIFSIPALIAPFFCTSAIAHHSPGAFDMTKESVIDGVITEVSWRNPHVYLTVETTGADGEKVAQEIEAAAASSLVAYGVQADDLAIGERVSIKINPDRRGAGHQALGQVLTLANGEELALRAGAIVAPGPAAMASSLNGNWVPDAATFMTLAAASEHWPFTSAGQAAVTDVTARMQAAADCSPFGIPLMMVMPNVTTIVVGDERISFAIDGVEPMREVHLATEFPHEIQPSASGYSIAHWEEETLVVETRAFSADPEGLGFALPSSNRKHVFERFTLSPDKGSLVYEAILEDPEYLAMPVNIKTTWAYRPDIQPSGQDCDMESALRFQANP